MKKKLFSFPPPPPDQPTTSVHTKPTNPTSVPAFFFCSSEKKTKQKTSVPPQPAFFFFFPFFFCSHPQHCSLFFVLLLSLFPSFFLLLFLRRGCERPRCGDSISPRPSNTKFKKNAPPFFFLYLARARALSGLQLFPLLHPLLFFNVSRLFSSPTALAPVEWGGSPLARARRRPRHAF